MITKFFKFAFSLMAVVLVSVSSFGQTSEKVNEDFRMLHKLVSEDLSREINIEQINYYTDKLEREGKLNEEEIELFAKSLGYENRAEAANYTDRFFNLTTKLDERYGIYSYNQKELEEFFVGGFIDIGNEYSTNGNNCQQRLQNCQNIANGIYAGALVACTAATIGIATANFWNAGIVGFAAGGICVAGAVSVRNGMLSNCNLDYSDCINN